MPLITFSNRINIWAWAVIERTSVSGSLPARTGDLQQAQVRRDEEGLRAVRALRLRDRPDHLLVEQQAVPVRQHRHGSRPAQVHRVQRAPRVPHQQEHHRGKLQGGKLGGKLEENGSKGSAIMQIQVNREKHSRTAAAGSWKCKGNEHTWTVAKTYKYPLILFKKKLLGIRSTETRMKHKSNNAVSRYKL